MLSVKGAHGCSFLAVSGANQIAQAFLWAARELSAQQGSDQPAAPPGRELEVSIEPDERAALPRFGQGDALVVDDAEWQVHHNVEPPLLWVHTKHVESHLPVSAEARSGEVDHLAG